jgi:hypothetical protein
MTPAEAEEVLQAAWRTLRCTPLPDWYIAAARAWGEYLSHAWETGEEITAAGLARYQLNGGGAR